LACDVHKACNMTPTHYLIPAADVAKLREALIEADKFVTLDGIPEALAILANAQGVGVVGYATHHDEPMLFPTHNEAGEYCDTDEFPRTIYAPIQGDSNEG
jgi:hypothetical protein